MAWSTTITVGSALAVLLALPVSLGKAGSTLPHVETLQVPSSTLTDEQLLSGDKAAAVPVTLTGELRMSESADTLPVVVLLHTSAGVGDDGAGIGWRNFLNNMGIATFRLDSFGGRGIDRVIGNQAQLPQFVQLYDGYRAVDVLASDPRLDPERIAVMGFSRGATATLYASQKRFLDLYGPTKTRIAAFRRSIRAATSSLSASLMSAMRRSGNSMGPRMIGHRRRHVATM